MTSPQEHVDAVIAKLETDLAAARRVRELFVATFGGEKEALPAVAATAPAPNSGRPRVADGSLAHRVLVACGEPTKLAAIVASAGAREPDVKRTIRELVDQRHLRKLGSGAGTKYQRA